MLGAALSLPSGRLGAPALGPPQAAESLEQLWIIPKADVGGFLPVHIGGQRLNRVSVPMLPSL
jgi:hypothetical protein